MNSEDINKLESELLKNIKIIMGKNVSAYKKNIARSNIEEGVETLTRRYIYRQALSSRDELARRIYKVMYNIEAELLLYLETKQGISDEKITRVHHRITLFL